LVAAIIINKHQKHFPLSHVLNYLTVIVTTINNFRPSVHIIVMKYFFKN